MIRILSNGEIVESIGELALSNGLFEVELVGNTGNYKAIMSEIKTPSPQLCAYLIEHLPKVDDLEEHEALEMAYAIMRGDKKSFSVNAVIDIFPYLVRIGVLAYQKKPINRVQMRFFFRRVGTSDQIKSVLSSPPSLSSLSESTSEPEKPKKEKKKKQLVEESIKPKKKKKKKKTCCDNPHPVKSKKTGKRRCKNCGAKLVKKKKKVKA